MQHNWSNLADAVQYYTKRGYNYIDVPWWVTREALKITCPPGTSVYSLDVNNKCLIASGEQAFLYMLLKGQLIPYTHYQTVTPCFRDDAHDLEHRKNFMKNELFYWCPGTNFVRAAIAQQDMTFSASGFFKLKFDGLQHRLDVQSTDHYGAVKGHSEDIIAVIDCAGIELGSYGVRYRSSIGYWAYGTGCAEPRLSSTIEAVKHSNEFFECKRSIVL